MPIDRWKDKEDVVPTHHGILLSHKESCPPLWNPMDCSLPGSAHGILQARILEWVTLPSCRGIFPTQGLKLGLLQLLHSRQILYCWATGEAHLSPLFYGSILNLQCCFNFHHTAKWFKYIYIYIYIYIYSFQVLFHYHRIWDIIRCAVPQDLAVYPFHA